MEANSSMHADKMQQRAQMEAKQASDDVIIF